jgi:hypothetical protein
MSKNKYYGYQAKAPENIVIQSIKKDVDVDGFRTTEMRYIIVDADTGKVFDDAQGYGYKTKQKAYAAFNYKKRSKQDFAAQYKKQSLIKKWCKENKKIVNQVNDVMFVCFKERIEFSASDLADILKKNNVKINSLPFSVAELHKIILKY